MNCKCARQSLEKLSKVHKKKKYQMNAAQLFSKSACGIVFVRCGSKMGAYLSFYN